MDSLNTIKRLLFSVIFVGILVFFDQISKNAAFDALNGTDGIPLIKDVLELLYVENTGAAFSFLSGQTGVFLALTPCIMLLIVWFLSKIPSDNRFLPARVCLLVLLAGALGNFIDRVTLQYVRDFIYFKIINFPIFNVADIYVTLSLIILVILFIFKYKNKDMELIFKGKNQDDE